MNSTNFVTDIDKICYFLQQIYIKWKIVNFIKHYSIKLFMYINKIISSSQQTWVRIFPFKQLDAYTQQLHQKNFHHMGFTHYSYVYKTYPSIEEVSSKIRELLYCAYRGKLCFFQVNPLLGVTTQSKSWQIYENTESNFSRRLMNIKCTKNLYWEN